MLNTRKRHTFARIFGKHVGDLNFESLKTAEVADASGFLL